MWIPVYEPGTKWLLFKYDPKRDLVEVQRRGVKTLVDLAELRANAEVESQARAGHKTEASSYLTK